MGFDGHAALRWRTRAGGRCLLCEHRVRAWEPRGTIAEHEVTSGASERGGVHAKGVVGELPTTRSSLGPAPSTAPRSTSSTASCSPARRYSSSSRRCCGSEGWTTTACSSASPTSATSPPPAARPPSAASSDSYSRCLNGSIGVAEGRRVLCGVGVGPRQAVRDGGEVERCEARDDGGAAGADDRRRWLSLG